MLKDNNIKILNSDESLKRLFDKDFISTWKELASRSSNFTLIQEYDLVASWYKAYLNTHNPVIVIGTDNNENIVGILPLAISIDSGRLSHAGEDQAEYNGWICDEAHEEDFLINALISLKQKFSLKTWNWGWMPPHSNASWVHSSKLKKHGIYINISTCDSPMYRLEDTARINKIKKSKSLKSKINRLKREGELRIERIRDRSLAEEVFKEIKQQCNFRNLSLYNHMPFLEDPNKEQWHLNHLEKSENVHFSVLWQGDKLLACNFGYCTSDTVIIGLFTYNPVQGAHSPGNVFLIKLMELIQEEGYQYLDLSPGGDSYKERFCNTRNSLVSPVFCFSPIERAKVYFLSSLKNYVKKNLSGKFSIRDIATFQSLREKSLASILKGKLSSFTERSSALLKYDAEFPEKTSSHLSINCQSYGDLLKYKDNNGYLSHKEVVFSALKNFERGDKLYTLILNNKLIAFSWVSETKKKHWNTDINKLIQTIKNDVLIYDVYVNSVSSNIFSDFITKVVEMTNSEKSSYILKPTNINKKTFLNSPINDFPLETTA